MTKGQKRQKETNKKTVTQRQHNEEQCLLQHPGSKQTMNFHFNSFDSTSERKHLVYGVNYGRVHEH